MTNRKLRTAGHRPKAPFGSQEAAILAAAGINVAGSLASAAIGASATKKAAQDQANATIRSATKQAQAIKDQSAKAKEAQMESQEFIKEQNAENRELQKDIQLQLQMLTGQQNVNDRLEASKIKVKAGGSTKNRFSLAGNHTSLLQGGNLPFKVTDGGAVLPIGTTPEGYDLYEIVGNDHEHYHKAQGGKHKTGVGIKFADGNVIEGEGNQGGNQGEYLLNTPTNAYFISRHSIAGVNPAKMVNAGMHPLKAYAIQEQLKSAAGINDDGSRSSSPVKRFLGGTQNPLAFLVNASGPQPGVDTSGDTSVGVVAATQQNGQEEPKAKLGGKHRCLKCGGRKKFYPGGGYSPWDIRSNTHWLIPPTTTVINNNTTTNNNNNNNNNNSGGSTRGFNWTWSNTADLMGAGIGALGNVGGALITSAANRSASRTLADAYNRGADILAEAYRSLKGIDMSSIRKEDYAAAHAMPALQAPVSQAASQVAGVDRQLQRRLANAGRYSASGAAAQRRMSLAETDAQDMRNRVWSEDQQQMQQIRQQNAQRVSEAAMKNAELDTAANQQYASAYLNLLQYNNDIDNQKILGAAGATAEGAINGATAISQAQTANAAAWAKALTGSSQGFANSLSNMATRKADLEKVMIGASSDSQATYYANPRMSSEGEAREMYNSLKSQLRQLEDNNRPEDADMIKQLKRRINTIAAGRGFDMV